MSKKHRTSAWTLYSTMWNRPCSSLITGRWMLQALTQGVVYNRCLNYRCQNTTSAFVWIWLLRALCKPLVHHLWAVSLHGHRIYSQPLLLAFTNSDRRQLACFKGDLKDKEIIQLTYIPASTCLAQLFYPTSERWFQHHKTITLSPAFLSPLALKEKTKHLCVTGDRPVLGHQDKHTMFCEMLCLLVWKHWMLEESTQHRGCCAPSAALPAERQRARAMPRRSKVKCRSTTHIPAFSGIPKAVRCCFC